MLKIRLQRTGRKNEPTFRIVLTDSKNSTKSGKYKEVLGSYDARKDQKSTIIRKDRVKHWLSVGAEATGTVHNLLLSQKVIEGKKMNVLPKKTPPIKETEAPVTEAPKEVAVPVSNHTETPGGEPTVASNPVANESSREIPQEEATPVADEAK